MAKRLQPTMSGQVAVAQLNRSIKTAAIDLQTDAVGLDAAKGYTMRDLWAKKDFAVSTEKEVSFDVPAHGVVVLKLHGSSRPYNVFQHKQGSSC